MCHQLSHSLTHSGVDTIGKTNFYLVFLWSKQNFWINSSCGENKKNFSPLVTYSSKGNLLIFFWAIAERFYCLAWQSDNDNIIGKRKSSQNLVFHLQKIKIKKTQNQCKFSHRQINHFSWRVFKEPGKE